MSDVKDSIKIVAKDTIALVEFDLPGEKINKFSTPVMKHFKDILIELKSSSYKAVVFVSRKSNIFIAGADIEEIRVKSTPAEFQAAVDGGQEVMNLVEDLPMPTIAAIHGACVGGGCEMVMACDYRYASDDRSTKIGLPETKLGIIPGFGGCVRLPRIVGLQAALDIILAGKTVPAKKARKIGLVDEVMSSEILEFEALKFAKELASKNAGKRFKVFKAKNFMGKVLESALGRKLVFKKAKEALMKKSKGHYPALLEALKVIKKTYKMTDRSKAMKIEAKGFVAVAPGQISKNLVNLFFLTEKNKKMTGLPGDQKIPFHKIQKLVVLGAGTMGGGIAQLAADKGIVTRMKDLSHDAIQKGFQAAYGIWNKKYKRRRLTKMDLNDRKKNLTGGIDDSGLKTADLIVEAIVENMGIKKKVIADIASKTNANCIMATNTSSLSVNEMAEAHPRPENFVGLHYFNPVDKMPLIEVIRGEKTSDKTTAAAFAFAKKMGKIPVVVKDGPGFLVNRLLLPWMSEALFMFEQGADIKKVDRAFTHKFGTPMGPFRLMDEVGLDVCVKVLKIFKQAFGARMEVSKLLEITEKSDRLGRKNKKGFYKYNEKGFDDGVDESIYAEYGLSSPSHPFTDEECIDRGILAMVNEASRAFIEDQIVESAEDVDLAMIMGTGFPPFRGGLLKYADTRGLAEIVTRLGELHQKYGLRFEASKSLVDLAHSKGSFYEYKHKNANVG